jgi:hypothetical protein
MFSQLLVFRTIPKVCGFEAATHLSFTILGGSLRRKVSPRESRLSFISDGDGFLSTQYRLLRCGNDLLNFAPVAGPY